MLGVHVASDRFDELLHRLKVKAVDREMSEANPAPIDAVTGHNVNLDSKTIVR